MLMYTFTQSIMKGIWEKKKKTTEMTPQGLLFSLRAKQKMIVLELNELIFLVIQGFKNWT